MREKRAADEILSEYSFTEGIKKVCPTTSQYHLYARNL